MSHTAYLVLTCFLIAVTGATQTNQRVRVVVRAPASTPEAVSIYLTGSLPSVGSWKPNGVKLVRQPDNTYSADLDLPTNQTLEFKFTRGNWATVEKYADGSDRPNRQIAIKPETKQIEAKVDLWGDDAPDRDRPSTVVGNLKLHTIDSQYLKQPRTIRVWLPPDYDADKAARYPVLYMHDGQNCFNRAMAAFGNEWEIDETLTKLINDKRLPPIIVVGVDHGGANRINELTYDADAIRGGGQGTKYADFLLREVKPFVDKIYRTQPDARHTFVGGSSLGGLASLDIARRHPNTFAGVIAMSPTLGWADHAILKHIDNSPETLAGARVWIDMGTHEASSTPKVGTAEQINKQYLALIRNLDELLAKQHVTHRLVIDDEHTAHNESAWASRFPQAIMYILDTK